MLVLQDDPSIGADKKQVRCLTAAGRAAITPIPEWGPGISAVATFHFLPMFISALA